MIRGSCISGRVPINKVEASENRSNTLVFSQASAIDLPMEARIEMRYSIRYAGDEFKIKKSSAFLVVEIITRVRPIQQREWHAGLSLMVVLRMD
jgi:hypothetical protein